MKKLLTALVILLSCSGTGSYKYETQYGTVDSDIPLNEQGLELKLELAEKMYDKNFGLGQFRDLTKRVRIHVRADCHWEADPFKPYPNNIAWGGQYLDSDRTIQLEPSMKAVVHEFRHAQDFRDGVPGSSNHENWNVIKTMNDGSQNSNYGTDWDYRNAIAPYPASHPDGFDMKELDKYGTDGDYCWGDLPVK